MVGTILAWVKSNLLIVISIALILILLPVGWFFSNGWNTSIQEQAQDDYKKEKNRLNSASSIEYSLPAVLQGERGVSEDRAPNAIVTNFYKTQKELRESQVAEVVDRGTAFNMAGHVVPVDGLLPQAANTSELKKKGFRLGEFIAGTQDAPSIYARLIRKLNAGDAPQPDVIAAELSQYKSQQEETYAATSPDGNISDSQSKQLSQDLIQRRLGQYAGQAESLSFYCPLNAIQIAEPIAGYSQIPQTPPAYDSITEQGVYTWVWDYWVVSDVLRAVASANTDDSGVSLTIPDAPVKHIEDIRVAEFAVASADAADDDFSSSGGRGGRGGRTSSAPSSSSADPNAVSFKSYTDRTESDAYDIRYVDLTIIASSQDLPLFFDALGKTNYMTVIDTDLSQVDSWEALERGYYYGDDHIVRAHITIETVWLRSWTAPLMPETVRQTLGVVLDSNNPDDTDG